MFDQRWNEADWRDEQEHFERLERQREARDNFEYYQRTPAHSELPAMMQDDAGPIGMSCDEDYRQMAIAMARRLAADVKKGEAA